MELAVSRQPPLARGSSPWLFAEISQIRLISINDLTVWLIFLVVASRERFLFPGLAFSFISSSSSPNTVLCVRVALWEPPTWVRVQTPFKTVVLDFAGKRKDADLEVSSALPLACSGNMQS